MGEKESKKRRRSSVSKSSSSKKKSSTPSSVRITKIHAPSSQVAVGSFGAVEVPEDTEFQVYETKSHGKTGKEMLVYGENSGIEYEGTSEKDQNQYVVALYDADNGSVELYPAAHYIEMKSAVTAKKYIKQPSIKSRDLARTEQRNTLGQTFGTRKAKRAITELAVNRIDATLLNDIQTELLDSVSTSTANLPTQDEVMASLARDRPIPAHNLEAEDRQDIYPLFGIVPKREWNMIRVESILREKNAEARKEMVPGGSTDFVAARLIGLNDASKHIERMQLVYYTSVLMTFFINRKSCNNKSALSKILLNPPDMIVNGLLDRFVAVRGGSEFGKSKERGFTIDTPHETKLLCYLLAMILRLDNYILEVLPLSTQLGLKPSRLQEVLRQLGCVIKNASATQAEALGLNRQMAATYKIATLSAPLKLPEIIKRKRRAA